MSLDSAQSVIHLRRQSSHEGSVVQNHVMSHILQDLWKILLHEAVQLIQLAAHLAVLALDYFPDHTKQMFLS